MLQNRCIWILSLLLILSVAKSQTIPAHGEFRGNVKSVEEHSYAARGKPGNYRKGHRRREFRTEHDFKVYFDRNGLQLTKEIFGRSNRPLLTQTSRYDSTGQLISTVTRYGNNRVKDSTGYKHYCDSSGRRFKTVVLRMNSSFSTVYYYRYDQELNCSEYERKTGASEDSLRLFRTFDHNGRMLTSMDYQGERLLVLEKFTYDALGRMISDSSFFGNLNTPATILKWKYDTSGHVERYEIVNKRSSPESWTYKYEFDEHGNWIRSIEFRNGKAVFIKERTITYY